MSQEAMNGLLTDLSKSVAALHETIKAKFSSAEPAKVDAEKDALVNRVHELEKSIDGIRKAKAVSKIIFDTAGRKAGEGERVITFANFMKAVGTKDLGLLAEMKTANGQSEGSNADGGFVVPTEFATEIVKLESVYGIARQVGRLFPIGSSVRKVGRQLTNPTVTWTDEAANHTKTKVTFDQVTQTVKKLSALIPMTEELLADNNVNLDQFIFQVVAEAVAREEDNQAFAGSGSPFTGVVNASNVNSVTQSAANPSYQDLVDTMYAVAAPYRANGVWVLDSAALKLAMKITDANNNPIWGMAANGAPGTLLGKRYYETDVLSSKALFGDFGRYLWISDRSQYEVKASDSASDANGAAGSAFLQDEIWYKFRKRESIDVALGAAFAKITLASA